MEEDKIIAINQNTGEPITQSDLDGWCNCFNFPHQMCDECNGIFSEFNEKRSKI